MFECWLLCPYDLFGCITKTIPDYLFIYIQVLYSKCCFLFLELAKIRFNQMNLSLLNDLNKLIVLFVVLKNFNVIMNKTVGVNCHCASEIVRHSN